MGNWTFVGPYLAPHSLMSSTHFSWSERPFAEIPISFTPRFSKSGALKAAETHYISPTALYGQ